MVSRVITRTTQPAVVDDPHWNGYHLPAMKTGITLGVVVLVGPLLMALIGLALVPDMVTESLGFGLIQGVIVAALGAIGATLLALPLSWFMARSPQYQYTQALRTVVVLLLVCPPFCIGIGLAVLSLSLDQVGLPDFPGWLMAIGYALVLGLPVATLTLEAAWRNMCPHDERVAADLGWAPKDIFTLICKPQLTPFLRPAFGLAMARSLGEVGGLFIINALINGGGEQPLAWVMLGLEKGHLEVQDLYAIAALLLALSVGLVLACKGALFSLIPQVSHRISTHIYHPEILNLEAEVEGEEGEDTAPTEPGEDCDFEEDRPEDVEAFFASMNGPGLAYQAELSEEETAYLNAYAVSDGQELDPIWEGAPGMPRAWAEPGTYWPGTGVQTDESAGEVSSVSDGVVGEDDTLLGKKTASPFLRIRTFNDDAD